MNVYVEASAVAKLLVGEAETQVLISHLSDLDDRGMTLMSSYLTETEIRRVAVREQIGQEHVTVVLDKFDLVELDPPLFRSAGIMAGPDLRSLDALHIAAAIRVDASEFVSYDARQLHAAADAGLTVVSPS